MDDRRCGRPQVRRIELGEERPPDHARRDDEAEGETQHRQQRQVGRRAQVGHDHHAAQEEADRAHAAAEAVGDPAPNEAAQDAAHSLPSHECANAGAGQAALILQVRRDPADERLVGEEVQARHQRQQQRDTAHCGLEQLGDRQLVGLCHGGHRCHRRSDRYGGDGSGRRCRLGAVRDDASVVGNHPPAERGDEQRRQAAGPQHQRPVAFEQKGPEPALEHDAGAEHGAHQAGQPASQALVEQAHVQAHHHREHAADEQPQHQPLRQQSPQPVRRQPAQQRQRIAQRDDGQQQPPAEAVGQLPDDRRTDQGAQALRAVKQARLLQRQPRGLADVRPQDVDRVPGVAVKNVAEQDQPEGAHAARQRQVFRMDQRPACRHWASAGSGVAEVGVRVRHRAGGAAKNGMRLQGAVMQSRQHFICR